MEEMRLQKYLAMCGVASRRAAEEIILQGRVKINGEKCTVLGTKVADGDIVSLDGEEIKLEEKKYYIMLNKPTGYMTTVSDEEGRPTVMDLITDISKRVYPVGRLDRNSEGLLIMTNDGDFANKLTHPRHEIPKIYRVSVRGIPNTEQLKRLGSEMKIDGYKILPVKVELISRARTSDEPSVLQMTLYEGRNRQIRKMCEAVDLKIRRLTRVSIGKISLGSLPTGRWRRLTKKEIDYLKEAGKNPIVIRNNFEDTIKKNCPKFKLYSNIHKYY